MSSETILFNYCPYFSSAIQAILRYQLMRDPISIFDISLDEICYFLCIQDLIGCSFNPKKMGYQEEFMTIMCLRRDLPLP